MIDFETIAWIGIAIIVFVIFPDSRIYIVGFVIFAVVLFALIPISNFVGFVRKKIVYNRSSLHDKALINAGHKCEKCGETYELQVHHKDYKKVGGKDVIENIKVLCKECHEKEHGYDFSSEPVKKIGKSKKVQAILDAIASDSDIEIVYVKYTGEQVTRKIKPIKPYIGAKRRQYLDAFDYYRDNKRTYRISRIKKIISLD